MISGYPIWVVLLIGCGVFCASFVDAIGGGGGIISVPVYLLAGLPTHFALGTNKYLPVWVRRHLLSAI